jgi:predicted transposase YbfD/YdcC
MQDHDLLSHFSIIQDYRQTGKIEHKLSDILLLVICAVIAGADGWEEIEDFGHNRLTWLQEYADFDNGIPSHDTLARVMSLINPQQFQRCS